MAGLPHIKNNKAGMEMYEPVYLNLFEVTMTPPTGVTGWDQLVIDNIQTVGGVDVEKAPGVVIQSYKGTTRSYLAALPDATFVDIAINWEVNLDDNNSMYVYKALRRWSDLAWDPLTGAMTLKKTYAGGPMTISVYNKVGDITRQLIFPVILPATPITPMTFDYTTGETLYSVDMTFRSDYWEDMSV